MDKVQVLAESFGYSDSFECMDSAIFESIVPAICMNPNCDYTTELEPDSTRGFCECCQTNTVASILVLCGVI
jgi:hypothetical protein